MANVMTVNGPIDASKLGITLMHEHIYMDATREVGGRNGLLNDPELMYEELMLYKEAGGVSIVDQTTGGLRGGTKEGASRDLMPEKHCIAIKNIAKKTGVNIILGAGWYRDLYYPEYLHRTKTNEIADGIIKDIEVGMDGTEIKAGIIGEIGSHTTWISPVEERVFRAVARAHKQTNLSIATHTAGMTVGLDQLDLLEEEGVDLSRVTIGHCHSYNNHEYHLEIARRGAYVQFDRMGETSQFESETWLNLVLKFINAGLINQLLISQDVCVRQNLTGYGGKGYAYIITKLKTKLKDFGITEKQFNQIMIDNPKRALTGE